jgi:hypothetical protein
MRFDYRMNLRDKPILRLPACLGSWFDGLIGQQFNIGAGL